MSMFVARTQRLRCRPMPTHWRGCRRKAGFTLIEVVVALAILALCAGALFSAISSALQRTGQAHVLAQGELLAQSLLAKAGVDIPLRIGRTAGEFANRFRWRLTVEGYGEAADRQRWPVSAFTVIAEVTWDEGGGGRSVILRTLRIGPKETAR